MKKGFALFILLMTFISVIQVKTANGQTYCNPLNLSYRFSLNQASKREIADPTVVLYKDNYFLFASKAGGYWHSGDLLSWKFVTNTRLPFENQAPTAAVIGDWLYFFTSFGDTIFRSNDPISGKWEVYNTSILLSLISDFAIFADTDGRIYSYYGCTNNDGVMSRELDANDGLKPIGVPVVCRITNPLKNSRKKAWDKSDKIAFLSVKGSWMNKYKGKYYFQCAELDNDLHSYSDVVYVSEKPTGPFVYAVNNPFSFRPEGFGCGAANGSTFEDKYGNWWHIAILTTSANNESNPRLGLFPAGFDQDGNLFTKTDFGDYPIIMPNRKYPDPDKLYPEWSLLSFNAKAEASSSMAVNPISLAFDENSGTFWSAQSGKKDEWLTADLGSVCTVNAIQVNFAENNAKLSGRADILAHQYLIEYSTDGKNWKKLSDKTSNTEDLSHQYEAFKIPVQAQYVKITNYRVPDGTFAISGFRIFGTGTNNKPKKVKSFRAIRDYKNTEITKLFWEKQENVTGYNIRYGIEEDKLYHSYQVYENTPLKIRCPDKNKTYWFEIDAFNENGVTPGNSQLSH